MNFEGTCPYGGDGWCHGPNNNEECNYDDGDCCLESANMCGYCEDNYDCLCHETGLLYCNNLGKTKSSSRVSHDIFTREYVVRGSRCYFVVVLVVLFVVGES